MNFKKWPPHPVTYFIEYELQRAVETHGDGIPALGRPLIYFKVAQVHSAIQMGSNSSDPILPLLPQLDTTLTFPVATDMLRQAYFLSPKTQRV